MNTKMKIVELFDDVDKDDHKTYVIAEIGINHEGSVERCAEMIRASADAGADAIKLQTVDAARSYAADTEASEFSTRQLLPNETANMFS